MFFLIANKYIYIYVNYKLKMTRGTNMMQKL